MIYKHIPYDLANYHCLNHIANSQRHFSNKWFTSLSRLSATYPDSKIHFSRPPLVLIQQVVKGFSAQQLNSRRPFATYWNAVSGNRYLYWRANHEGVKQLAKKNRLSATSLVIRFRFVTFYYTSSGWWCWLTLAATNLCYQWMGDSQSNGDDAHTVALSSW